MRDAQHLRIVFQVCDVGFVMPVTQLMAIRGSGEFALHAVDVPPGSSVLGTVDYHDAEVMVYDLPDLMKLDREGREQDGLLLVFSGADSPWAVLVDQVYGVVGVEELQFYDLPAYVLDDGAVRYRQLAQLEGQLLVSLEAALIEAAWSAEA